MSEQEGKGVEPIQWLIEQLDLSSETFTTWFEQFLIDSYTDDFRGPDEFERHGFTRPEEEPDGTWYLPESEQYPTGDIRICFWIKAKEVLAFSASGDPVMCMDHFYWYRIPVEMINTILEQKCRRRLISSGHIIP